MTNKKDLIKELKEILIPQGEVVENNDLLDDIALALFGYRLKHNLSQIEIAKLLGVSQPMIVKLESGDYNPSVLQLSDICKKLKLNLSIKISEEVQPTTAGYFYNFIFNESQPQDTGFREERYIS